MAEVFLRQSAGFLRTTTCTMVEVFLRQVAGFLSNTTNTTNNGPRTKTVIGRR